jgi:hypothetical protein
MLWLCGANVKSVEVKASI